MQFGQTMAQGLWKNTDSFRWPWRRGPPLTIPNREVKPVCADGTATPSGRVGRRLFLKALIIYMIGAFFLQYIQIGTPMA